MTFLPMMKSRSAYASAGGAQRGKLLLAGGSVLAMSLFAVTQPALGATATAPGGMAVSATVVATCTVSATALAFGNYTGAVNAASSTVSVTCTNSTPYTLSLGAGSGTGATTTNRSMTGGGVALGYGLFSDSAHTTNFDTTASITANGSAQPVTIYGQIPAGEYVAPGSYTDTITATVTY